MAKYAHKVRMYQDRSNYSKNEYPITQTVEQKRPFVEVRNHRTEERRSIEEWLDWQCEGGWELFKFHPEGWCVFRKKIE